MRRLLGTRENAVDMTSAPTPEEQRARAKARRGRAIERNTQRLMKDELPRVRASALAWRNGLAALLVGIIGFSLVRGRSDISSLESPYTVIVGVLLLGALVTGIVAALFLLRAAHGRPWASPVAADPEVDYSSVTAVEHAEALSAAKALTTGLVLGLVCTAMLAAAVGTTWYGPAKDGPRISVDTPTGTWCGEVVRLRSGMLTLKTAAGEVNVELRSASTIQAVDTCIPAAPAKS
jgi:hypothetical protein